MDIKQFILDRKEGYATGCNLSQDSIEAIHAELNWLANNGLRDHIKEVKAQNRELENLKDKLKHHQQVCQNNDVMQRKLQIIKKPREAATEHMRVHNPAAHDLMKRYMQYDDHKAFAEDMLTHYMGVNGFPNGDTQPPLRDSRILNRIRECPDALEDMAIQIGVCPQELHKFIIAS